MQIKDLEQLVKEEIIQRKEEGCDATEIEKRFTKTERRTASTLNGFLKALGTLSVKPDFPYEEPSELREIRAQRPMEPEKIRIELSDSELYEKIYGGWLGRCAGCLLGKPVEGLSKEQIEDWLKVADAYPLRHYFPPIEDLPEDAPDWLENRLSRIAEMTKGMKRFGWFLGQINCMVRDDDIDYTVLGLHILENHGQDFTTRNVAETWLYLLPYWQVYTAERVAYRNLVNGIFPPESATYMNPYREWIGAQIRADMWGYVTPGMPDLAAELSYRDAIVSHVKNGIYGEMFAGAMISAAFATHNIEKIIEAGLSVIPKKSRLAEAIKDVVLWSKKFSDWKDTWNRIFEKYGHYHFVHTINNAAIVVMGLLYGQGDYERSITISVMGGFDTDCNGATTGSILGVMHGAGALPSKWIGPLNNVLESFVIGYNNSQISDLAKRTATMAVKILGK